ncbi:MAG TPA: tetratricopeptide repeat protein, partial [Paraburkholderia sp.]
MTNCSAVPHALDSDTARWRAMECDARKRLARRGDDIEGLVLLAISLQVRGQSAEAAQVYVTLTALAPNEHVHWSNYAIALRECGRIDDAVRAHETALDLAPFDAGHWIDYALLLLHNSEYARAHDAAMRARALDLVTPQIAIRAAQVCAACREYDEAERILKPWRTWLPLDDDLQCELAELLLATGDGDAAILLLTEILRRSPCSIAARVRTASTYERLNRVGDAENVLAAIAALPRVLHDGGGTELAHVLSRVAMRNGDIDAARAILTNAGPRNDRDAAHYFALAEVQARCGNADDAMAILQTAHAVQVRELAALVPQRFVPGASPLPLAERRVSAHDHARWPVLAAPDARHSPVFVVGFPRSG